MRLADFLESKYAVILDDWVEFARCCEPAARIMDEQALRDHALGMLKAIMLDLRTPQSAAEQAAKSKASPAAEDESVNTAAGKHGAGRAQSGFSIGQMVAEFRALRANVLRLWSESKGELRTEDLADLTRFNEALDQTLAESITRYTREIGYSQELFVAILGHDLRTPLSAITLSSHALLDSRTLGEANRTAAERIGRSAGRMNLMIGDLLDLTRCRLGSGIPLDRQELDLAQIAEHAVQEARAAWPRRAMELQTSGELRGYWDGGRISQVLANLLSNAAQHGVAGSPIRVTVAGEADRVELRVQNFGPSIPREALAELFSPFKRLRAEPTAASATTHLGLGLYIVEQIAFAHGGVVTVESDDKQGTTFLVHLPR